jgi:two-component system nitrogen regulation sensor histidine kinase NtrY
VQELVRQAVFLQRVAHPQTAFEIHAPPAPVMLDCDGRLVSQALTNVLKNATEAVGARISAGDAAQGNVTIDVKAEGGRVIIAVRDNGVGLPKENRHRLTEPYVTTRAKGTGLGLAIVRKVLEDHGGELWLDDNHGPAGENFGAIVTLVFPQRRPARTEGVMNEAERVAGIA